MTEGEGGCLSFLLAAVKRLRDKWCCCYIGQELFDLFIRNRLIDKVHFFRIVHILKVTELFPEEFLIVIGAENVF